MILSLCSTLNSTLLTLALSSPPHPSPNVSSLPSIFPRVIYLSIIWCFYAAEHRGIFKSNLAICLKRQVYNSCVLPAMTYYGAETGTLTKQAQNTLAAAQTNMERSRPMLNITYKDRKTNIWVREGTKVIDIVNIVRKMKWSWAGHINRLKDDRWTSRVTTWRKKKTMEASQAVERRPGQILERHDMAEGSTIHMVICRRHAEAFAQARDTTAAQ